MDLQTWKTFATFLTVSAGVIAVVGPFWISNISEKIAARDKHELNKNFSDLKSANLAIQAKLDPFIELATERFPSKTQDDALTALQENLSKVRAKTDQISKRLEQREFSKKQAEAFLSQLEKLKKIHVQIDKYNSDSEAIRFADQLTELFKKAGWQVKGVTRLTGAPPKGIIFGIKERSAELESYVEEIGEVLKPFGTIHGELWDKIPSGELLILVGAKD